MKKTNKWFRSPIFTVVAFAVAAVLLLFSGIGGARAALTYFSEVYTTEIQMYDIGVALLENGAEVSHRNYQSAADNGSWDEKVDLWHPTTNEQGCQLLQTLIPDGEEAQEGETELVYNKKYKEVIQAQNPNRENAINEFVRITIYKYWMDADGNKDASVDPGWISLEYDENYVGSSWIEDTSSRTDERQVFYYTKLLVPDDGKNITDPLTKTISVNNEIAKYVTQKTEGNKLITTYTYDGYRFCVEARVDAVQEHNAAAAIKSAWGKTVTISSDGKSITGIN